MVTLQVVPKHHYSRNVIKKFNLSMGLDIYYKLDQS